MAAEPGRCAVCGSEATGAACSDDHARRPRTVEDDVVDLAMKLEPSSVVDHLMRTNRSVCG